MEWNPIDLLGELEASDHHIFLLMDEYMNVYVGSTPFEYYDAKYWCPMPKIREKP